MIELIKKYLDSGSTRKKNVCLFTFLKETAVHLIVNKDILYILYFIFFNDWNIEVESLQQTINDLKIPKFF